MGKHFKAHLDLGLSLIIQSPNERTHPSKFVYNIIFTFCVTRLITYLHTDTCMNTHAHIHPSCRLPLNIIYMSISIDAVPKYNNHVTKINY